MQREQLRPRVQPRPGEPQVDEAAVRRAEIGALAEEEPGEVANLLRGWLVGGQAR